MSLREEEQLGIGERIVVTSNGRASTSNRPGDVEFRLKHALIRKSRTSFKPAPRVLHDRAGATIGALIGE
jgi:hypothetical protein